MKNHFNLFCNLPGKVGIAYVTTDHFNSLQTIDVFKPTPAVKGVVKGQGADVCALTYQHFREMRSDKSISPGHKNGFPGQFHSTTNPCLTCVPLTFVRIFNLVFYLKRRREHFA